jgi:hypothetical protein
VVDTIDPHNLKAGIMVVLELNGISIGLAISTYAFPIVDDPADGPKTTISLPADTVSAVSAADANVTV